MRTDNRHIGSGWGTGALLAVGLLVSAGLTGAQGADTAAVTVTWTFATHNMDGTPLTDLAGARVYLGTTSNNYTQVVHVPGGEPGQTVSFAVTGLVAGVTYYLNGTAYNLAGLESDFCNEAVKVAGSDGTPVTLLVHAGSDAEIMYPEALPLSGTVEGLEDGRIMSEAATAWTMLSGPGTVTFADPHALATVASFSLSGNYILELTGELADQSVSDRISVSVRHQPTPPTSVTGTGVSDE